MHSPAVSPLARADSKANTDTAAPPPPNAASLRDVSAVYSDSFELPRVRLWRIVLAVIGYALLLSDVARSGASLTELAYPTIEPNVFASDPPVRQPIRVLSRQGDPSSHPPSFSVTTVGDPSAPNDSVDSHLFKFAATSNGLRTLLMQRPDALRSWSTCLHNDYATPCPRSFSANIAFHMLDEMVDTVRDNANLTTCYKTMMTLSGETLQAALQRPEPGEVSRDYLSTLPQRVRFAVRAKSRWIDGASNFLSHYLLDKKYWLSIWATHFDDFNASAPGVEICLDELDRPLLCEKTWADFKRLAPAQGIDKIWDDLSDRAATLQQAHPTTKLEMTIIETETDPLTLFGGAVVVAHKLFDVVALYRLRDCAVPNECVTIAIHDVRYAGRVLYTDAIEWRYITLTMRWGGQVYVVLRLIFLLVGCYHAAPLVKQPAGRGDPKSRLHTTLTLFFAVPPQVVVYASFVPVLLYSCAHVIDGVVLYHVLADTVASLSLFVTNSLGDMIRVLSIHMRNVWVAAFAVRVVVFFETSGGWTPLAGVTGLKGYLLPLLSLGAVLFVLRDAAMEDARILEANEVEPSATFMFIRAETLDSWKMNAGGVYKDMLTVGLTTVVYVIGYLLLHTLRRCLVKRKDASWWPHAICWSRCDVPYSAGYLWDPSCLVVVWENDLAETVLGMDQVRPLLHVPSQLSMRETTIHEALRPTTNAAYILGDMPTRVVLMNLTFLSDPWTFLTVKFGHTRLHLYQLRHADAMASSDRDKPTPTPMRKVLHPYSKPRFLREFEMKADDVTHVGTFSASDMDWQHLILCR